MKELRTCLGGLSTLKERQEAGMSDSAIGSVELKRLEIGVSRDILFWALALNEDMVV